MTKTHVPGSRRTVVGVRAKADGRHPADHRVRQNGARIHETVARRPDRVAESG